MNILVTGGKGFLGSHLIPALEKKGYTVRSYDLKDKQDILNIKQLSKAIAWSDVVYHLAALTDVQESIKKPVKYFLTNGVGTLQVCKICTKLQKKLIYTSTAATYNPTSSPYALSKFDGENFVSILYPFVLLRLFNVYGEGMNKTTMIARFQKENPITIYGDGKQTRDFIYIDDVIEIMVSALDKKWNGFVGDVGTAYEHTVLYFAKLFKKPIQFKEERKEVRKSVADIKALRKLYKKPFKKLNIWITQQ